MAAGPCRAIQLIAPDRTVRLHYFSSHLPNTNPADARARALVLPMTGLIFGVR